MKPTFCLQKDPFSMELELFLFFIFQCPDYKNFTCFYYGIKKLTKNFLKDTFDSNIVLFNKVYFLN
ncbi:hypothetical protein BpHYR1_054311 [Brachionus plicatilis]|uniref:Uncharacterized protein n=1 Tax=Brachionus plicatilis TaxID=10195 RepID=A0A3M7T532_BRAPC|nr:hypothetical protein BpHYR1_054311 [Brachionus plicatilis]